MKKINLKIPKIKINPSRVILAILLLALAGELFTLYHALYGAIETAPAETENISAAALEEIDIDLAEYNKIKTWIENRRNYVLPQYSLQISAGTSTASSTITTGRENPFADY